MLWLFGADFSGARRRTVCFVIAHIAGRRHTKDDTLSHIASGQAACQIAKIENVCNVD